jgi:WhiB family redox-sensing transcriptional regulator
MRIDRNSRPATSRPEARLFRNTATHANVRLFYTEEATPCADDPELFFNAGAHRRAIARCRTCPFRGRCSYNAVAVGATHGIWGGIMLPGDYPSKLAPIYAALCQQFNQRRGQELGDAPMTPLPDINTSPTAAQPRSRQHHSRTAVSAHFRNLPGRIIGRARPIGRADRISVRVMS